MFISPLGDIIKLNKTKLNQGFLFVLWCLFIIHVAFLFTTHTQFQSFHMHCSFPRFNRYRLYLSGSWQCLSGIGPAGWLWSVSLFRFPLPVLSITEPALTQLARGQRERGKERPKGLVLDQTHDKMGECEVGRTMF